MPAIVSGEQRKSVFTPSKKLDYDYPRGLDLTPGSPTHNKVTTLVMDRAYQAGLAMSKRFESWNEIDRTLTTYIWLDDKEKDLQDVDERKPVSIVYPYSYAILETLMSYMMQAFFQNPVFQYQRTDGGSAIAAMMLEMVIQQHVSFYKLMLPLHTMIRDNFAYGFGAVALDWRVERGKIPRRKIVGNIVNRLFRPTRAEKEFVDGVLFEGNYLKNIDPYSCLPDPNAPIHDVQNMEYFGWVEESNINSLLKEEQEDETMFNVRYLNQTQHLRTSVFREKGDRNKKTGRDGVSQSTVTNPVDTIYMYVDLIPAKEELGDGEYPEWWLIGLSADSVVVRCEPVELNHGRIPVAVCASDFDGYAKSPVSRMEIIYGMQHTLNWMFNTHVANIRKSLNDTLIYDPYLLNSNDLKDPKPGGLIRLRRPAWGRGVKDTIMQLNVQDVTRQHVSDSMLVMQHMERVMGTDASSMGSLRQGGPERLTGREFEGTQIGKYARLERLARIIGEQAFRDIGYMMAAHTQQFMDEAVYMSIYGPYQEALMRDYGKFVRNDQIKVTPYDLLIPYDVIIRDGTIPGGNFSQAWIQLFDQIAKVPELHQQFDLVRIFKHIARNLGAKNVDDFARQGPAMQVSTAPDQQVLQQAQQGNLVPTERALAA